MEVRTIADTFLELHQTGSLRVTSSPEDGPLEETLRDIEADRRLEAPANAPPFHLQTALWATRFLIHGARFLLFREHPAEEVNAHLRPSGTEPNPTNVWSADIAFRYLPDLLHRAHTVSPDDILTQRLAEAHQIWDVGQWSHNAFLARVHADRKPSITSSPPPARPWLVPA